LWARWRRRAAQAFIVHARNAWLQGLSAEENREVPPLRYDLVHRLRRIFRLDHRRSTAASPPMRRSQAQLAAGAMA